MKPGPLKDDKYGEGEFTVVADLQNLPAGVREKVPEGYVIKQYKDRKFVLKDAHIFEFDPDFNEGSEITQDVQKARSPMGIAKKLQERQRLVRNYFDRDLPDLVVPSQFIVGSWHVYEIQRKMPANSLLIEESLLTPWKSTTFAQRAKEVEQLTVNIRLLCQEKVPQVKQEIETFVRLIEQMFEQANWFLDLESGNLLFTKDGLRIIDTNYGLPWKEWKDKDPEVAARGKLIIQKFSRTLRELAEKL